MESKEESRLPLLDVSVVDKNKSSISRSHVTAIFCSRNPLIPEQLPDCHGDELDLITSNTPSYDIITKDSLTISKNLSVDELKKIQEWLLHQVYNTSNTLVELLQERHQLSEQAHMRLISIEQLHRLLEARCFYRRLTGLFS